MEKNLKSLVSQFDGIDFDLEQDEEHNHATNTSHLYKTHSHHHGKQHSKHFTKDYLQYLEYKNSEIKQNTGEEDLQKQKHVICVNRTDKSPIDMEKQKDRKLIFDEIKGPNENRFINFNHFPEVNSKFQKTEAPDFKRYAFRDFNKTHNPLSQIHNQPSQPDYNPNSEYIKQSLSLGITPFEKQTDRESYYKISKNSGGVGSGSTSQSKGLGIKRVDQQPDIYTYSGKADKAFKYLSQERKLVEFNKQKSRDNSMYYINEGNNLEQKEQSFIERMIEMDVIPNDRRISNALKNVLSQYGVSGGGNDVSETMSYLNGRNFNLTNDLMFSKINVYSNLAKNSYKISKSHKNSSLRSISSREAGVLTLEQKILSGYYNVGNNQQQKDNPIVFINGQK